MADTHDLVHLIKVGDNGEASVMRSYLQHHGIQVHVQGENHRSLLGMVGAYVELSIMVPGNQLEESKELLEEYYAGTQEVAEPPEMRGPHRDQFDDDEDEEAWEGDLADKLELRRVTLAAFLVPFGGGHLAAGATFRGLLLAGVAVVGIARGIDRPPIFALWPAAIGMDIYGARGFVRNKPSKKKAA